MTTLHYQNVSESRYQALLLEAQKQGLPIAGETGEAAKLGIHLSWVHDPESGNLDVVVLEHPWFASVDKINSKLTDLLAKV